MHLADVSVRRVDDITEVLFGSKVLSTTISELSKKLMFALRTIGVISHSAVSIRTSTWTVSNRAATGVKSTKCSNRGAIAVNVDGFHEILGAPKKKKRTGLVEPAPSSNRLDSLKLIIGDKCMGILETVCKVFLDIKYP